QRQAETERQLETNRAKCEDGRVLKRSKEVRVVENEEEIVQPDKRAALGAIGLIEREDCRVDQRVNEENCGNEEVREKKQPGRPARAEGLGGTGTTNDIRRGAALCPGLKKIRARGLKGHRAATSGDLLRNTLRWIRSRT